MLSKQQFHTSFYFLATLVLAAALPLSHFLMGLVCFLIFLNWIAEWNWSEKLSKIRENRQFLLFSAFYVVYAIGLFKATDFNDASKEMLSKVTFLMAPIIIISSEKFNKRQIICILTVFVLATLFGCVWNIGYTMAHEISDYREMSRFIDHIRFSLCVVMSIVFSIFCAFENKNDNFLFFALYLAAAFLLFLYLLFSQTLSGIVILAILFVSFLVYILVKSENRKLKLSLSTVSVLIVAVFLGGLFIIVNDYYKAKDPSPDYDAKTVAGRSYSFSDDSMIENGYYIDNYVCEEELAKAWGARSDTAYDKVSATLIRYLNSLGMRKDSAAVMSISTDDVRNVENKCANVVYAKRFSVKKALYQTFFGVDLYRKHSVYTESSLLQRFELWRNSWELIRENPLLGVGIGNQRAALDQRLEDNNSPIANVRKNRGSHNQFLTFWLAAGIIPLLYFVFILAYPFVCMPRQINFVYFVLILTLFISMLVEDTLNAQTGRMLYTIFAPLLLFSNINKQ